MRVLLVRYDKMYLGLGLLTTVDIGLEAKQGLTQEPNPDLK
jgi:hypothetical protein